MDIEKLDKEHVGVIRECIPALAQDIINDEDEYNPEYFKGINIEDPEQVFNALASRAEKDGCKCLECVMINVVLTMFAVYFHDLLNDEGLEWSDRQKATLSKAFFEFSMGASNIIASTASEYKEKAMIDALMMSILAGSGDAKVIHVPDEALKNVLGGLLENLKQRAERDGSDEE